MGRAVLRGEEGKAPERHEEQRPQGEEGGPRSAAQDFAEDATHTLGIRPSAGGVADSITAATALEACAGGSAIVFPPGVCQDARS